MRELELSIEGFQSLSQEELLSIDGGATYWKYLVNGTVGGAAAGAMAGPIGAFVGAHTGAIAGSAAYFVDATISKKWK